MTLPPRECNHCLKGLRDDESIFGDGFDYSIFSDAKPVDHLDGWDGSSVNWDLPVGGALEQLMQQVKNGKFQFGAGAIRIPRVEIDKLIRRFGEDSLRYELLEENGNIYHGHILFSQALAKRQRTTISALLVNANSEFHRRE